MLYIFYHNLQIILLNENAIYEREKKNHSKNRKNIKFPSKICNPPNPLTLLLGISLEKLAFIRLPRSFLCKSIPVGTYAPQWGLGK